VTLRREPQFRRIEVGLKKKNAAIFLQLSGACQGEMLGRDGKSLFETTTPDLVILYECPAQIGFPGTPGP
jgi:hypothetical protein